MELGAAEAVAGGAGATLADGNETEAGAVLVVGVRLGLGSTVDGVGSGAGALLPRKRRALAELKAIQEKVISVGAG